jgi:hypothetical protein
MTLGQGIGLGVAIVLLAWALVGFWRGLSLKPNDPDKRLSEKGSWWRT